VVLVNFTLQLGLCTALIKLITAYCCFYLLKIVNDGFETDTNETSKQ
jgi:hypothetical protein